MKRQICTVFLVLAAAAAVSGGDFSFSAGAGGILGGLFTRYTLSADGMVEDARIQIEASQKMNQFSYGFFAFFDATYCVLSVFYQNGANTYRETADVSVIANNVDNSGKGWESMLGFSLLGKYPFPLSHRMTVFPLLGLDYQICLNQSRTQVDGWIYDRTDGLRERDKDGKAYRLEDWNSLFVNLGGGVDFMLPMNFFLRGELLYGFRLMTSYETKNLDLMKSQANDSKPKLSGLTSGPLLRISAGYTFWSNY